MDKLDQARERLETALNRLETMERRLAKAIGAKRPPGSGGPQWDELVRAMEATQKENAELSARENKLRRRVDDIIGRVAALLDDGAKPRPRA